MHIFCHCFAISCIIQAKCNKSRITHLFAYPLTVNNFITHHRTITFVSAFENVFEKRGEGEREITFRRIMIQKYTACCDEKNGMNFKILCLNFNEILFVLFLLCVRARACVYACVCTRTLAFCPR